LNGGKLFFMIRFLLVLAGLTGYTLVYSQKIKLINTAEVVERGKQLYDSGKYSDAIKEYLTVPNRATETYKKDVLDGSKKIYYDNGQACSEYRYASGGYHGEYKTYYSNGNVREKGSYDRDERHGLREKYNEDGSLSSRENYVMGSRQGKAELFVKGSNAVEFKFNGGMTYE